MPDGLVWGARPWGSWGVGPDRPAGRLGRRTVARMPSATITPTLARRPRRRHPCRPRPGGRPAARRQHRRGRAVALEPVDHPLARRRADDAQPGRRRARPVGRHLGAAGHARVLLRRRLRQPGGLAGGRAATATAPPAGSCAAACAACSGRSSRGSGAGSWPTWPGGPPAAAASSSGAWSCSSRCGSSRVYAGRGAGRAGDRPAARPLAVAGAGGAGRRRAGGRRPAPRRRGRRTRASGWSARPACGCSATSSATSGGTAPWWPAAAGGPAPWSPAGLGGLVVLDGRRPVPRVDGRGPRRRDEQHVPHHGLHRRPRHASSSASCCGCAPGSTPGCNAGRPGGPWSPPTGWPCPCSAGT